MSLLGTTNPKKKGMSKRTLITALLAIALVSSVAYAATTTFITGNITANISAPPLATTIPSGGIAVTSESPASATNTFTATCPASAVTGTTSTIGLITCTMALNYSTGGIISVTIYGNQPGQQISITVQDTTSTNPEVMFGPQACNSVSTCNSAGSPYTTPVQTTSTSTSPTGIGSGSPFTFTIGFYVTGTTAQSDNVSFTVNNGP